MTDQSVTEKKSGSSIVILLAAIVASVALGAGSYLLVNHSDISIGEKDASAPPNENAPSAAPQYLPLDPVFVTLARTDPPRSLRFEATLELHKGAATDIDQQMPRLIDLTNTYLRATEFADLREPAALMRIRAQLLRRYESVVGEDMIRDLLVTKFLID